MFLKGQISRLLVYLILHNFGYKQIIFKAKNNCSKKNEKNGKGKEIGLCPQKNFPTPFNDSFFGADAIQLMDKNENGKLSKEEYMQRDWQKIQDKLFSVKGKKKPIEYK
jgi:hypothetical protein